VERSDAGSPHPSSTESDSTSRDGRSSVRASAGAQAPDRGAVSQRGSKKRRTLIAGQQYFGLDAQAFRDGAEQSFMRVAALPPERQTIDLGSVGKDFSLDASASWALLRAMLEGGLLRPTGPGSYRPTRLFREYALAKLVAPIPRSHARELINGACSLAAHINAHWNRNPFRITLIAVSGSYMSRRARIPELSLWLILGQRPEARMRRRGPALGEDDARREIVSTLKELSSFIVVRVVSEKEAVDRPFSVAFQIDESEFEAGLPPWQRFREWGAALLTRRLAFR
jgi:hypothetical protein